MNSQYENKTTSTIESIHYKHKQRHHPDRIFMPFIFELNFKEGLNTTARRLKPKPQLNCLSGSSLCRGSNITNIRCREIQYWKKTIYITWECLLEYGSNYEVNLPQVICEGYDHDLDPYILKDSCSLNYQLRYESPWKSSLQLIELLLVMMGSGIFIIVIFVIWKLLVKMFEMIYLCKYPKFCSDDSSSYQPLSSQNPPNYNAILRNNTT